MQETLIRNLIEKHAGGHAFVGRETMRVYGDLLKRVPELVPVPVDMGTRSSGPHWHGDEFSAELMSPKSIEGFQALSRVTLASLVDLGYEVKVDEADAFALPQMP